MQVKEQRLRRKSALSGPQTVRVHEPAEPAWLRGKTRRTGLGVRCLSGLDRFWGMPVGGPVLLACLFTCEERRRYVWDKGSVMG